MSKPQTVHGVDVTPTTGPGEEALRAAIRSFRPGPGATSQRMALWRALVDRTNAEDLRNLCFLLGLDYDAIPGSGRSGKAREIVSYFQRREDLDALTDALNRLRPDIEL